MSSGRRRRARPALGRALRLTALSALLPGAGHIAAGRRFIGGLILASFVILMAGLGVLLATVPRARLVELVFSPDELEVMIVLGVVVGLVWVGVVYRSWMLTRPRHTGLGQRVFGLAVVALLCLGVATPFAVGVRTAYEQRDFLTSVFPSAGPTAEPSPVPSAEPSGTPTATPGPTPTPMPANNFGPGKGVLAGKDRINVLLLGGDGGYNRDGVRTDSMIMASIDTATGRTVLVSLPRNLQHARFVPGTKMAKRFPNGFNDLLNSVYTYAEDNPDVVPGAAHPGAELIRQTFSYAIGQDIDYYVLVNMAGFRTLVDAIGGITMDVTHRIPVGGKTDANGRTVQGPSRYLEPGKRKLSGESLLWYGRSRYGSDDYSRMERQRCVLGAIARQADPFELLTHFRDLAAATRQIILTDIPIDALPELLTLGGKGAGAKVTAVTFVRSAAFSPSSPDFGYIRDTVAEALDEASPGGSGGASADAKDTHKAGVSLTRVCDF